MKFYVRGAAILLIISSVIGSVVYSDDSVYSGGLEGDFWKALQYLETKVEDMNTKMEEMKKTIPSQQEVQNLKKENENLRRVISVIETRLNANPSTSWLSERSYGGGASAVAWASECPNNEVMVGIEIVTGGTCGNKCDPDGRAFHKYRIKCAKRN